MRALIRDRAGVRLEEVAAPHGEVVIDVAYAGVCRTDLAVADGRLGAPRVILGHELSGWLDGAPVTAIPFTACGECDRCPSCARWLGVDVDGAFAERVAVPASAVVPLPRELPLVAGAYVEPVAAALGALPAISRGARVLVSGAGRIAELSARVIAAHGAIVARHVPGEPVPRGFDVAVEHGGDAPALVSALRAGGTLIVKSRERAAAAFDLGELVARDLCVRGASHGSFAAAVDWLASRRIIIDDLLAPPRPLDDFAAVLADARDESRKQVFAVSERCAA
jgi:threonine dehydrogenase-like Zn-dependent dehydrogenase